MGKLKTALVVVSGVVVCTTAVAVAVHWEMEKRRNQERVIRGVEESENATPSAEAVEKKRRNWERAIQIVEELESTCKTPNERLMDIANAMVDQMNGGLANEDNDSSVKMLISFVDNLPSGGEEGLFYALDLGGTNFRVLRVRLNGNNSEGVIPHESSQEVITEELKLGTSKVGLFDHIADQLAEFINKEGEVFKHLSDREREIGFTFSFPVLQHSIDSGTLIKWTKGFAVPGVVDQDVVAELSNALERKGLNVHVTALVNDTVGTLAGGRFMNKDVIAAVILGTGTNAAYVERANVIEKLDQNVSRSGNMVINTEWGGFNASELPLTEYDNTLDFNSLNSGEQIFEKMISGMYLGEIVRLVLCKMAKEAAFFGSTVPTLLEESYIFSSADMSNVHHDSSPDLNEVGDVFSRIFDIRELSLDQRRVIVQVCNTIAARAARLAAAGILGILKKVGRDKPAKDGKHQKSVVAVDGSLFNHYDEFKQCLETTLQELLGDEMAQHVELRPTADGSGIGAALIVASNSRYRAA